MSNSDESVINERVIKVYNTLSDRVNVTAFAKSLGYTTTAQWKKIVENETLISSKSIYLLIQTYNVNPSFIFLGKGSMFITDKDEVEQLRNDLSHYRQSHDEVVKKSIKLAQMVKELENRNFQLQDNFSDLIGEYKNKISRLVKKYNIPESELEEEVNNDSSEDNIKIIDEVLGKK